MMATQRTHPPNTPFRHFSTPTPANFLEANADFPCADLHSFVCSLYPSFDWSEIQSFELAVRVGVQ